MAENQHPDGFITFQQLGHAAQRGQGGWQHHVRTVRVEGALHRRSDHQQIFPTLKLEMGTFDRFTHLRLVHIQPGLSHCRRRHWHCFRRGLFRFLEKAATADQYTQSDGESFVGEHRVSTRGKQKEAGQWPARAAGQTMLRSSLAELATNNQPIDAQVSAHGGPSRRTVLGCW